MIIISHRGNVAGPNPQRENSPEFIDEALSLGFEVEIDLHVIDGQMWLGHDRPQYQIDLDWFLPRAGRCWVHCKNVPAMEYFYSHYHNEFINFFWHENDTMTLTNHGYMWVYPGCGIVKNGIAVMPEIYNDDVAKALGICTDWPLLYREKTNGPNT